MRQTRFRADLVAGEGLRISGVLAPYNQRGSGGDLFRPGLFDVAGADLLLYLQHDRGAALARTDAGLVVSDSDQGILLAAPLRTDWLQLRDPHLYDRLTDADIDALCFPARHSEDKRRRHERIAEGRRVLDKLVREGDAEWRDGRLLPPPPSDGTGALWPENAD